MREAQPDWKIEIYPAEGAFLARLILSDRVRVETTSSSTPEEAWLKVLEFYHKMIASREVGSD